MLHSDRLDSEGQAVRAVRARTGSPLAPCPTQPLPEAWQVFRRWIRKQRLRRVLPLPSVSTETCSQCPGQRGFAWARCTPPSRLFQGLCGLQDDLGFPPAVRDPNLFFKKTRALVSPHCGRMVARRTDRTKHPQLVEAMPPPLFTPVGHVYKFFGYSFYYTVLYIPAAIL